MARKHSYRLKGIRRRQEVCRRDAAGRKWQAPRRHLGEWDSAESKSEYRVFGRVPRARAIPGGNEEHRRKSPASPQLAASADRLIPRPSPRLPEMTNQHRITPFAFLRPYRSAATA